MNEATMLKAEKAGKEKGYAGKDLHNFLQGFSEGFNRFKKTIKGSEAHEIGYDEGRKEIVWVELARTRRELNGLNKG